MKDTNKIGQISAIFSAVIFGIMPIFTKKLYSFGADFITCSFYRMSIPLILIFLICKIKYQYKMNISKVEFLSIIPAAAGFAFTGITLFNSYNYIPSGTATSIHFLYPVIIFIVNIYILKEMPEKIEVISLLLVLTGLILMMDFSGKVSVNGIILALISALTYSFYSIYIERSRISNFDPLKLLFYINLIGSVISLLYSIIFENGIFIDFEKRQWTIVVIYAILITLGATFLYQLAVLKIGSKMTSILSTFEPITSLIVGVSILHETYSFRQLFSTILILMGVITLLSRSK